ncbi:MAG: hypothetical protein V4808_17600 [Pseudomonadota bacterium]
MLIVLGLLLAAQQVGPDVVPMQRVSERLHSLHPPLSCNRKVARRQKRLFDRRFAKRIVELERQDTKFKGEDPGFEIIALGYCSESSAGFDEALRKFDSHLSAMEREFRRVR